MNTNEEKDRKDYEKWYVDVFGGFVEDLFFEEGDYLNPSTRESFAAWKAGRAALRAESEPVCYQFYENGKWHNFINEAHRKNTEAAGYPMRALSVTAPQTEPKDTGSGM